MMHAGCSDFLSISTDCVFSQCCWYTQAAKAWNKPTHSHVGMLCYRLRPTLGALHKNAQIFCSLYAHARHDVLATPGCSALLKCDRPAWEAALCHIWGAMPSCLGCHGYGATNLCTLHAALLLHCSCTSADPLFYTSLYKPRSSFCMSAASLS